MNSVELESVLKSSVITGLINRDQESIDKLRPKLVINNYLAGASVLSIIEEELLQSKSFYFSVAFITSSGLICLKTRCMNWRKGISREEY